MSLLELILIFVLHFEAGISGEPIYLYNRSGHDVILPCTSASPSDTTCSIITWIYSRDQSQTLTEVQEGKVEKRSARAARMSLNTSCSLVINNITAEDAGYYTCRQGTSNDQDTDMYLNVLTISPSPPDADPKRDGEVTLVCSLSRHNGLDRCQLNSVRWVDETGTVLLDEGVGYKFLIQMSCVSVLKVKRQSGHNRRYTCQFVDENNVKIEADYTTVFIGGTGDGQPEKPHSDSTDWPLSPVMLALRITALILMIVITVLVIRHRVNTKPLDDDNVHQDGDKVNYETVEARPATTRLH